MMKRRHLAGLIALAATGASPAVVSQTPLRGICDVAERRRLIGRRVAVTSCPATVPPVRDIHPESYYVDRAYSIVDPEKLKRYHQQVQPLTDFSAGIAKLADQWLLSRPAQTDIAVCTLKWLDDWAAAGALLGNIGPDGQHQRKWLLAGITLAYLKIRDAPQLDTVAKHRVEQWMSQVGRSSLDYYASYFRRNYNNHIWWVALAAIATATCVNDHEMFDRAVQLYYAALDDIQPDGTMPNEMARKGRAMIYHVGSLTPLVMVAEFGEANGLDLYAAKDGALHRLADRVRDGLADPSWFAAQTGVEQDWGEGTSRAWAAAWAEPYYVRFPDPRLATLLEHSRPIFSPWLGGSPTHDFGSLQLPMH
jgi:poly(beta-D-mannuronate) lyase